MITRFYFEDIEDLECFSNNFPIDIKIGESIHIGSFEEFLTEGNYEDGVNYWKNEPTMNKYVIDEVVVTKIVYDYHNGEVHKFVFLEEKDN